MDGNAWRKIDHVTIAMPPDVRCGLCLTSHNENGICPAVFDHVSVEK
jgi:hypothetical protein